MSAMSPFLPRGETIMQKRNEDYGYRPFIDQIAIDSTRARDAHKERRLVGMGGHFPAIDMFEGRRAAICI